MHIFDPIACVNAAVCQMMSYFHVDLNRNEYSIKHLINCYFFPKITSVSPRASPELNPSDRLR